MVLSLLVIRGNEKGQTYEVTSTGATIGRDLSSAICLTDLEISRRHCRIDVDARSAKLTDLKSSNGTLLNGLPVVSMTLEVGDQISVGQTVFIVLEPSRSEQSADPSVDHDTSGSQVMPGTVDDERYVLQVKSNLQFIYDAFLETSRQEVGPMMDNIIGLIFEWVSADRGCVLLRDGPAQPLKVRSMKQRDPAKGNQEFTISQSIVRHVDDNNVGVLSTDIANSHPISKSKSFKASGISEVLCVPIQGRRFTLGQIYIDRLGSGDFDGQCFNDSHLKLMHVIAHQAAIAIENEEFHLAILEKERMLAVGETAEQLSHRIKNILQSISGGTHLVESGLSENSLELVAKGWEIVKRNQDRMSDLVLEMLAINEKYIPQYKKVEVLELVIGVVDEHRIAAQRVGVEIDFEFKSNSNQCLAGADLSGIETSVRYVIAEAVKNSRGVEKAVVKVVMSADAEKIEIAVRSADAEIDDHPVESHISEIFFAAKQFFPGLELSAAQKILRGHQGDLEIRNEVSFEAYRIWFPRYPPATSQDKTAVTPNLSGDFSGDSPTP